MATLSLGMIKMVVNYAAIEQEEDWTDYKYSIRLFVKDFPLFSEQIENEIQKLTKKIKQSWVLLAEAEEEVEEERQKLISSIRKENMKEWRVEHIFTVNFDIR